MSCDESVFIAQGGVDRHCPPTTTCAFCAREGLWRRCAHCQVAYYCSISCRENHLDEHKEFCDIVKAKRIFVEQDIYSIRQLVQEGNVIRISHSGETVLSVGRYECPSPVLDAHDSMIAPVLKVIVNATDARKTMQINAAFSMSATTSVISERLASKIGLSYDKKDVIDVVSPRCWKREAFLPGGCLYVKCTSDVVSSKNRSSIKYMERPALQVAPIICPAMTIDLMLGRDWLQHFGEKTSVIYGPGDDSSKIKCVSGVHIALPWERLDCSPRYNRHTSYSDHILAATEEDVLGELDNVRGFPYIGTGTDFKFNPHRAGQVGGGGAASWLDPVMSQHDLFPVASSHNRTKDWHDEENVVNIEEATQTSKQLGDPNKLDSNDFHEVSEKEEDYEYPPYPWEEYTTPEGAVFYYNSETGESSWEIY